MGDNGFRTKRTMKEKNKISGIRFEYILISSIGYKVEDIARLSGKVPANT